MNDDATNEQMIRSLQEENVRLRIEARALEAIGAKESQGEDWTPYAELAVELAEKDKKIAQLKTANERLLASNKTFQEASEVALADANRAEKRIAELERERVTVEQAQTEMHRERLAYQGHIADLERRLWREDAAAHGETLDIPVDTVALTREKDKEIAHLGSRVAILESWARDISMQASRLLGEGRLPKEFGGR